MVRSGKFLHRTEALSQFIVGEPGASKGCLPTMAYWSIIIDTNSVSLKLDYSEMEDIKSLDMDTLVDLLSTQTSAYIQMHILGAGKGEFKKTQLHVEAIQAEIKSRRKADSLNIKSKARE